MRGREGRSWMRIKYRAREDRQAEGREEASGPVDMRQMLVESRDLEF